MTDNESRTVKEEHMRPIKPPREILEKAKTGEMGIRSIPEHGVAYAVYQGSHAGLQNAFLLLMKWISENGYELMGPGEAAFMWIRWSPDRKMS